MVVGSPAMSRDSRSELLLVASLVLRLPRPNRRCRATTLAVVVLEQVASSPQNFAVVEVLVVPGTLKPSS